MWSHAQTSMHLKSESGFLSEFLFILSMKAGSLLDLKVDCEMSNYIHVTLFNYGAIGLCVTRKIEHQTFLEYGVMLTRLYSW